ncbi:hypothetical protein BDV10DRAFT_83496 [Aspergillus recurvatus]
MAPVLLFSTPSGLAYSYVIPSNAHSAHFHPHILASHQGLQEMANSKTDLLVEKSRPHRCFALMALISSCMNCQLPKLARSDRSGIFCCILPLAFRRPSASVQAGHCGQQWAIHDYPTPVSVDDHGSRGLEDQRLKESRGSEHATWLAIITPPDSSRLHWSPAQSALVLCSGYAPPSGYVLLCPAMPCWCQII